MGLYTDNSFTVYFGPTLILSINNPYVDDKKIVVNFVVKIIANTLETCNDADHFFAPLIYSSITITKKKTRLKQFTIASGAMSCPAK